MKESIDYPDSYYYHTANNLKARSSLNGSHTADICVIGAGYTGLCLLYTSDAADE